MTDPVEILAKAWTCWAANPGSHAAAVEREAAIRALGLRGNRTHDVIAHHRRQAVAGHPDGLSIPDAVQAAVNELMPAPPAHDLKEAS